MGRLVYVNRQGPHLSEGSRLLWLAMLRAGLSQEALRLEMGRAKGSVGDWLRGDGRPRTSARVWLHERFRIPLAAWDKPPVKPFKFEAA